MAQYLAGGLAGKGHRVTVYNAHNHPYQEKEWHGVEIVHCYDAEKRIGTAGQFIYDLNCIRDARKKQYDVILFLGYTSSSVWATYFPAKTVIISNMDGMEWKRTKYPAWVSRFLKYAEKLAVKYSDHVVADSTAVQQYLNTKYHINSSYIPYGAEMPEAEDETVLPNYGLVKHAYYMLMARMEPENNIDMILEGFCNSGSEKQLVVVGNINNAFGKKMFRRYGTAKRVRFTGAIFDKAITHTLRKCSALYFHGHSVGGTNPSLLEAMASQAAIAAHNNEFNRAVLQNDAFYFGTAGEVTRLMDATGRPEAATMISNNVKKIREQFNWPAVVDAYEDMIIDCHAKFKR